ncbi:MAG TPA: TMEM165/GDT1 family protein [Myxococcota bacterium]|nr:TMEM165/GDT1 family protein [Myxococcota bacterium]
MSVWRLFASTFGLILLAELGDKTQLATLALAASSDSRWVVFLAAASALVLTSAMAVLAGEAVTRVVPAIWIQRAAGVSFVALGLLLLLRASPVSR